jgi:hypothetical protein
MDRMSDPVHTVILCEDLQLRCFIRRFLLKRGCHARQIREVTLPTGGGAGVTWVREKLPDELKAYRSRNARAATCLVVGCDADDQTVEGRIQTLRDACTAAGVPFRGNAERVALAIPKRNIETWLAYLGGATVNEEEVYPKYDYESDCRNQVTRLDQLCQNQRLEPNPPPPSLVLACEEFRRIQA